MDYIWQEMAKTMIARDHLAFAADYTPEDLAAAMADAWGNDRAAAVWTVEDILEEARNYGKSLDEETARCVMRDLVDDLCATDGYDVLIRLIEEATELEEGDFE